MRAALFVLAISKVFAGDDTVLEHALALYNHTDYRGTVSALRQTSQDGRCLELMGRALYMAGDYRRATDTLEKAAAANPNSSTVQMWMGRAFGRRAETAFAIAALGYANRTRQAFEKAVELDPANVEAISDLLEFYIEAPGIVGGGLDRARRLVPLIAKHDVPESHFAIATLAEQRKDYGGAEAHFRKAAELAPANAGRWIDLAKFLSRRGRFNESDKAFGRAEAAEPGVPKLLFARAETYIDAKRNIDEAKDLLKKYLAAGNLTPEDPPRMEAAKLLKRAEGG